MTMDRLLLYARHTPAQHDNGYLRISSPKVNDDLHLCAGTIKFGYKQGHSIMSLVYGFFFNSRPPPFSSFCWQNDGSNISDFVLIFMVGAGCTVP